MVVHTPTNYRIKINKNMSRKNNVVKRKEKWDTLDAESLFRAVLNLRNAGEVKNFFRDLLTENEILEFSQRWKAARLLAEGISYREIGRRTWMSPRTIARIQKWLKSGKGGYRLMIGRLAHHPISSGKRSAVV